MSNYLVSIIIPNYNRAHLIGETLDSILAQTYSNWECIIVDDGSTDNSKEVIQKYVNKDARFQLHDRPTDRPKGANICRNYGFELSKGEFVNWFDSDDVMLSNFINEKLKCFNELIDLVICSGYITNNSLNNRKPILFNKTTCLFKDYQLGNIPVMTPSVLFKRDFLNNKELFSTKITVGQETELFSRLFFQLKEEKYKIIDNFLFFYRHHSGTKSRTNQAYIKKNKESQSYVQLENFKRGIQLDDQELYNVFYLNLFHYFYLGLENNHFINAKNIINSINRILWKSDKKKFFKFLFIDIFYYGAKRYGSKLKRKLVK